MATGPVVQRMMIHLVTIISTAYESEKGLGLTPQGPMFLAFNQQGYNIDYFNNLIKIGVEMGYWTSTPETIKLTPIGIEKAKRFSEIEKAHNN